MHGSGRVADQLRARQVLVEGGVVEVGQQHPAHRRGVGREARPDGDGHGHDPRPGRHPGDVDDVGSVEHRHRRRLVDRRHQRLHVGEGDLGQAHRGQVGESQLEHARAQREVATVALHVPELDEREQEPPGGGPRQPVRRLTSLRVRRGCSPSKARMTIRPRSNDWTKSGPRFVVAHRSILAGVFVLRTIVRRASAAGDASGQDASSAPSRCTLWRNPPQRGPHGQRCPRRLTPSAADPSARAAPRAARTTRCGSCP